MQVAHEDGVVDFPEEAFEDVGHVLDEVVSDSQLHVPSIRAKLLHQQLDPGLGPVLPVNSFMTQT